MKYVVKLDLIDDYYRESLSDNVIAKSEEMTYYFVTQISHAAR